MTVTIQISNSDNKLSQREWAGFVAELQNVVQTLCSKMHFVGGSDTFAPWKNACWVADVPDEKIDELRTVIRRIRKSYQQDSAAVTCGVTEFI